MSRVQLLRCCLRREFGPSWLIGAIVILAAAVWSAWTAADLGGDAPRYFASMVRRFDLTLLAIVTLLGCLRVAQRFADDRRSGWTEPYFAGGGSRQFYGGAVHASVTASVVSWFMLGAIMFAAMVLMFDDTVALLVRLPVLLSAGVLLAYCVIAYTGVVAVVVGEALSAVMIAAILMLIPLGLMLSAMMRSDGSVPRALWMWSNSYPPPITLAAAPSVVLHQVVYAIAATFVIAILASRFAGRRT